MTLLDYFFLIPGESNICYVMVLMLHAHENLGAKAGWGSDWLMRAVTLRWINSMMGSSTERLQGDDRELKVGPS